MLPVDKGTGGNSAIEAERTRKRLRKKRRTKAEKYAIFVYIPTAIVWIVGIVMTFCSTVPSIGRNTIFWDARQTYHIIGPIVLTVGIVMLMLQIAIVRKLKMHRKNPPDVRPPNIKSSLIESYKISENETSYICPNCHYQWQSPTDIRVDVLSGDAEVSSYQVYVSISASRTTQSNSTASSNVYTPTKSEQSSENDLMYRPAQRSSEYYDRVNLNSDIIAENFSFTENKVHVADDETQRLLQHLNAK